MARSSVTEFFAPVGNFFEERYESFADDAKQLQSSVEEAADSYSQGNFVDLPCYAGDVLVDSMRLGRRFSPLTPALTSYSLIKSPKEEAALFESAAREMKRSFALSRLGIELGLLSFGTFLPAEYRDDIDRTSTEPNDILIELNDTWAHGMSKYFAHLPHKVEENFHVLDHVEGREQQECWEETIETLKAEGKDLPYDSMRSYSDFLFYLEAGGISFVERLGSIENAVELVENRKRLSILGRDRPIAVVIGAKSDHNNAFSAKFSPLLDKLVSAQKFDVVYIEAGSDAEALEALKMVYRESGAKISLAVVAGHGSGQTIRLGKGEEDSDFWEVDDFLNKPDFVKDLNEVLAEDGQIVYAACSTGTWSDPNNLMRVTSKSVRGREVFGTSIDNSFQDIKFQGARIRDIKYDKRHREYFYEPVEEPAVPKAPGIEI